MDLRLVSGDPVKGLYFCAGHEIATETINYGTYTEALEKCAKIHTPKICDGNLTAEIAKLATDFHLALNKKESKSNFIMVPHRKAS